MQEDTSLPTAFVIMPFDKEFDQVYKDLIVPALEEAGFKPIRADKMDSSQNVMKDIVRCIEEADLVIADLTTSNANVFYELGITHGFEKKTIMLTQSVEDIPFDLRSYRLIAYSTNYREAKELKEKLKDLALKTLDGAVEYGNPVTDFKKPSPSIEKITNDSREEFGDGESSIAATIVIKPQDEGGEAEEEEKGLFDYAAEAEESLATITQCLSTMTSATEEFNEKLTENVERISKLQKTKIPGSAFQIKQASSRIGRDFTNYAKNIEETVPSFKDAWNSFEGSTFGILQSKKAFEDQDIVEVKVFYESVNQLKNAITFGLEGTKSFRAQTDKIRGISKDVNIGLRSVDRSLTALIGEMEIADSKCAKILVFIDDRLGPTELPEN